MKITKKDLLNYSTIKILLDDSFIQWVRLRKPVDNKWHQLIEDNPTVSKHAIEAEEILRKINFNEPDPTEYRIARIKNGIDAAIKKDLSNLKPNGIQSYPETLKKQPRLFNRILAAAVLIPILVIISLMLNHDEDTQNQHLEIAKTTSNGQKFTVFLRDGSEVKLNAASTLKYSEFFTDTSRIVYLEGEAFFDIAKDTARPFSVITKYSTTTALGTSFNIKVDNQLNTTTTSLESGRVAVKDENDTGSQQIFLEPGQQAISSVGRPIFVQPYDEAEFAWKNGTLIFKKDSYEQVFNRLEKWYGVQFKIINNSKKPVDWSYSGTFNDENLETVLQGISFVKGFTYQVNNKEIIINL